MLDQISTIISQYEELLVMLGIASAIIFVITLLLTPYLLGLIPVDYFSTNYAHQAKKRTPLCLLKTAVKTLAGVVLVVAGIIMLVTPGQGVISILLGIFLMEFPGKRQLEFKFINHDPTYKALNWLRNKAGKSPFIR